MNGITTTAGKVTYKSCSFSASFAYQVKAVKRPLYLIHDTKGITVSTTTVSAMPVCAFLIMTTRDPNTTR
jgi:hypothetical protein